MVKEINIDLPELHDPQEMVMNLAKRYNVVVCGRRWGKTTLGVDIACNAGLDGKLVGWFSPNYKYLMESFRVIRQLLAPIITASNATENRIELSTGGVIEFWTLENPDAGRSRKYDEIIIDEAGLVLNLGDIWREALRATLIDREGRAWFLGTPKPPKSVRLKDYAFHIFYMRGKDPEFPAWASFHQPSKSNPHLKESEIEEMRHEPGMTKRIARQEIDAEFLTESTDALWNLELINQHRRMCPKSIKKLRTVLFLDPGNFSTADSADPTGIVIACKADDAHYYVMNDLSGSYTPNQCAMLVVNAAAHYGAKVYFETNQGGEYVKSAIRTVSPISVTGVPSTQGKEQRALAPLGNYEMGLVHHEYEFVDMEDEMVNWSPYDTKMKSPNRMDALCGALNVLMKNSGMGMRSTKVVKTNAAQVLRVQGQ